MIRFRLAELIADATFKIGRRVTLQEVSEATGINRMTLSRMVNVRGYSTSTDTIDKLCHYFACQVGDVAQFIDEAVALEQSPIQAPPGTASADAKKPARSVRARRRSDP